MSVVTNGTLLDNFWINIIVEHFRLINISINAARRQTHEKINIGSSWDNVIGNIRKLIIKKHSVVKRDSLEPIVMLSMVLLKSNYLEMKELLKLAYDLGCGVVYLPCEGDIEENVFYDAFKNETICREVQQIIAEIKELNKIYKVPLSGIDALLDCSKPPSEGEQYKYVAL